MSRCGAGWSANVQRLVRYYAGRQSRSDGKVGSGSLTIKLLGETSPFSSERSPTMSATHDHHPTTTAAPTRSTSPSSWAGPPGSSPSPPPWPRSLASAPSPLATRRSCSARSSSAKARFGLPDDAPVVSCYEAGRDGFWLHRYPRPPRHHNRVVDSASIEVNRRQRRAKSDALDVAKLLTMLIRYHDGESKVWSVVRIPTVEDEDRRQPHRELIAAQGPAHRALQPDQGAARQPRPGRPGRRRVAGAAGAAAAVGRGAGADRADRAHPPRVRAVEAGRPPGRATWRTRSGARCATTRGRTSSSCGCC